MLTISMIMAMLMVSLESSIVTLVSSILVVTMMLVAITVVGMIPMFMPTVFREVVPLVCSLRMNLTCTELPLPVFFLSYVVVQSDCLIQQSLIVGGTSREMLIRENLSVAHKHFVCHWYSLSCFDKSVEKLPVAHKVFVCHW